jgi:hypothetical protein
MTKATSETVKAAPVRKRVFAHGSILILGMFACLFLAALVPMLVVNTPEGRAPSPARILAASADPFVVVSETQIMSRPAVTLRQARIFSDSSPSAKESEGEIVLDAPVLTVDLSGLRQAAAAESTAPLLRTIANLGFARLFVEKGRVVLSGTARPDIELTDVQTEVAVRGRGAITAKGQFVLAGETVVFDASLTMPPEKSERPIDLFQYPLRSTLKTGGLTAVLDGKVDTFGSLRFEGSADISAVKARSTLAWLGIPLQGRGAFDAVSIKGTARWMDGMLAIDRAKVEIDGDEASGALSIDHGRTRPLLDATLAFQKLDLARYLGVNTAEILALDLQLPLWRGLDADLRLSAKTLQFDGVGLGSMAATLTAKSGKLLADVPSLSLLGSTGRLQVGMDTTASEPAVKIRGLVESAASSRLPALLFGAAADAVSGRTSAQLDLTAKGKTLSSLGRTLTGRVTATMPEGGRLPIDLRQIKSVTAATPPGWSSLPAGRTNLEALSAQAYFENGTLALERIDGMAGDLAVSATGAIDVPRDVLNIRLNVAPRVALEKGAKSPAVRGVAESIEIIGAIGAPIVRPGPEIETPPAMGRRGAN